MKRRTGLEMALFGESAGRRREPRSLVEFRAGKMKFEGKTVTADVRKGLVYMKLDENLLHFCWKDRQKGTLEDVSRRTFSYDGLFLEKKTEFDKYHTHLYTSLNTRKRPQVVRQTDLFSITVENSYFLFTRMDCIGPYYPL